MQQIKSSTGKYVFNTNEWLTTGQIRSYFSRMRVTNLKTMNQSSSYNVSQRTNFSPDEDEEENDLDDEVDAEVDTLVSIFFLYV